MEFRDYAANEASALVNKLLASQQETALQQLRTLREAFDTTAQALEGTTPEIADEIQELVKRLNKAAGAAVRIAVQRVRDESQAAIDAANAELESERSQNARLVVSLEEAETSANTVRTDLTHERERAETAERDLIAALDTNKDLEASHRKAEADYRSESEARAKAEEELRESRALLDAAFEDTARLGGQLESEIAENSTLRGDLAAARDSQEQLEAARAAAEAVSLEESQARAAVETELEEVRASLDSALAEDSRLGAQLEASAAEKGRLMSEFSAAQNELKTANEQRDAIAAQLKASSARVHSLERIQSKHEENVRQLQARLEAARDSEASLRERTEVSADVQGEIDSLNGHVERLGSMLDTALNGVDEIAGTTTVGGLLAALVNQLATQFSRVGLFRVKSNRLEGEYQVGLDQNSDVTKLVIPLSLDSPLTRAVASGQLERLAGSELEDGGGMPFSGTPSAAVVLPVVLQGETLAVIYADDDGYELPPSTAVHDSAARFAQLMVRQGVIMLTRLSHELKTLSELRDYAALLLREAEEMHAADLDAGKKGEELRTRLKDNLDCARQLYSQRATLEGPAAAVLLDEQISAILQMQGDTRFAKDLAALAGRSDDRRTAEAS